MSPRRNIAQQNRSKAPRRYYRPAFETLESRVVPATLVVDNFTDTPMIGTNTLRERIAEANANNENDTITFAAGTQTITLGGTQLQVTSDNSHSLVIDGDNRITVSGNKLSRVFLIQDDRTTVELEGLTVTQGLIVNGQGGAILNRGNLTIRQVTVKDSSVTAPSGSSGSGGGIANTGSGAMLQVIDSLLLNNSVVAGGSGSQGAGGALYNTNVATVINSTLTGNSAGIGGGIYSGRNLTVRNSTIVDNSAVSGFSGSAFGGGIFSTGNALNLHNSIVADNNSAGTNPDIFNNSPGGIQTFNVLGTALSGTFGGNGNLFTDDPGVGPIGSNGGPTQTMKLLDGSVAINAADPGTATTTDQRGEQRDATPDIGAFELILFTDPGYALVVTTTADELDSNVSDASDLSLREAIAIAELRAGADTITFAQALAGQTLGFSIIADFTAGPSALAITTDVTIRGLTGDDGLTLDGGGKKSNMRAFYIAATGKLTLENLALRLFRHKGGDGGAGAGLADGGGAAGMGGVVFVNGGELVLRSSTFLANEAQGGTGAPVAVPMGSNFTGGGGGGGLGENGGSGGSTGSGTAFGGGPNGGIPVKGSFDGGFGGGGLGVKFGAAGGFGGGGGAAGGKGGFGGGGGGGPVGGLGGFGGGNGENSATGDGGGGAGLGGVVFNNGGIVTVVNSTFIGNRAAGGTGFTNGQGLGGAIFSRNGSLTITNATISGNTAADGGRGVFVVSDGPFQDAIAAINNSILGQADNSITDFVAATINNGNDAFSTGTNNLIRNQTTFGGTASAADPLLGALLDNGGPTNTMALLDNSPAIDAANPANAPAADQRGTLRDGPADIGAFEAFSTSRLRVTTGVGADEVIVSLKRGMIVVETRTNGGPWQRQTIAAAGITLLDITTGGADDIIRIRRSLGISTLINTGDGNDQVWTDAGNHTIILGAGRDSLHSTNGNNTITTGDDDDDIWLIRGNNTIDAGGGNNDIHAARGNNTITSGAGNDRIWVKNGNNIVNAGNGNNEVRAAGTGNNLITTGSGNDLILAGRGNDIISAGAGNDTVDGGAGRDLLIGGAGADMLNGGAHDDLLIAGLTAFDADRTALQNILAEWISARPYADRVKNLSNDPTSPTFGSRANGATFLIPADGAQQTAMDDGVADQVTGGRNRDWLLVRRNTPVTDLVADLAADETASELDS